MKKRETGRIGDEERKSGKEREMREAREREMKEIPSTHAHTCVQANERNFLCLLPCAHKREREILMKKSYG